MDQSSELVDKVEKKCPERARKGKKKDWKKNEEVVGELQNMKHNNIHIIGIPEGEEEEQGIENLSEKVMMENFLNLMREKVTKGQEAQRVLSRWSKEAHS